MTDVDRLVQDYLAMWNEPDADARRALVARTVTDDATYLDPVMSGEGIDGITTMIGAAQAQFPGHAFQLHAGPDAHHDRVRFSWSLVANGGAPVAAGTDYVTVSDDGRMQSVTGFLEASV
jgi:ketosteroid isomerase-like protein